MKLHSIETGLFKLDGGAMFGVVPKSIWQKLYPCDANNLLSMAMRCLLIETGDRLILVDNGIGQKQDERFLRHYYLHGSDSLDTSLAALGFGRPDITDVLLTHLHFDHCGGSIERRGDQLVPAFPRAVYWSNDPHWQWATHPNEREKASFLPENILPIQQSGQLQFLNAPSAVAGGVQDFLPGIQLRFVYGHTQAMMLPQIQYQGRTLVFVSDLLPTMAHLPIPYVMAYDMFPLTTLQEKKIFLEEALQADMVLFFEHDANVECCSLERTEKGIRSQGGFRLRDL